MPKTGTTTQRAYGMAHQQARAQYEPIVTAGRAQCTEPICFYRSRFIPPNAPWDLAHNRDTGGYRGPAHRRCNRSEGATYGNRHRRHTPTVWRSRIW